MIYLVILLLITKYCYLQINVYADVILHHTDNKLVSTLKKLLHNIVNNVFVF